MISFKMFCEQLNISNPRGEWEKNKQKRAEEDYTTHKGMNGAETGYYDGVHKIPVKDLINVKGANGEHKWRTDDHSPKYERLMNGELNHDHTKLNTRKHPITLAINHRGEAFVPEGNHRLGVAQNHNHKHVYVKIKYMNGGEHIDGEWHPNKIKEKYQEEKQ